jgi:pimeloyl-ACP methyl ester carboxylesterase
MIHMFDRARTLRVAMLALAAATSVLGTSLSAATADETPAPAPAPAPTTVVLVHGAFADGSSWSRVIPLLQAEGVRAVAVQNPLSSLEDDVDAVTRVIEAQPGPVVLVGHSWGGTVITEAGNHEKVAALVYVAAFAPDAGQSVNDTQKDYPVPGWVPLVVADSGGFLSLPEDAVLSFFAQDLSVAKGKLLAATQGPVSAASLDAKITQAAWRAKPSWYIVADQDRMISPVLEAAFADAMGAKTTHLDSSHLPFLSKPRQTTAVILDAVKSLQK